MAISIQAPRFSFVQFNESGDVSNCLGEILNLCLPIFSEDDLNFQFVITSTSEEEANNIAGGIIPVQIGIVRECEDELLTTFTATMERFKIGTNSVLFNFKEGLADFADYIEVGECFLVKVIVTVSMVETSFCSNCFQRIGDDCHTSIVEYGADDNAFGFNYCAGFDEEVPVVNGTCEPTFITFTNQGTLTIPYTASLQDAYGNFRSVEVWIRDENNDLVKSIVEVKLDSYPPNVININFGGNATGLVKLS
jgi:hypothetical protein